MSLDVGQAHIATAEAESGTGVVDAQKVQHGGVEVVDFGAIFHGEIAEVVGGAVDGAALDASAGHPDGKAEGVVVATVGG